MGHLVWCCLVRGFSLLGHLHAMCWTSVTFSAILGEVVYRSLPHCSQSSRYVLPIAP